jgi:hypothetical protein
VIFFALSLKGSHRKAFLMMMCVVCWSLWILKNKIIFQNTLYITNRNLILLIYVLLDYWYYQRGGEGKVETMEATVARSHTITRLATFTNFNMTCQYKCGLSHFCLAIVHIKKSLLCALLSCMLCCCLLVCWLMLILRVSMCMDCLLLRWFVFN